MLNDSSIFNDKDKYIHNSLNTTKNTSTSRFNFLTNNIITKYISKILSLIYLLKSKFDDWLDKKERKLILRRLLEDPNSFEEWKKYALELDFLEGKEAWKSKKETSLYDWKEVEKLIKTLHKKREIKDIYGIVHYIRVNLMKNLYSTMNPVLFQVCNFGTKYLLEEYQDEMLKSLDFIANFNEKYFPLYKKLEFFSETRHSYGRTALLLSGGASMGMYHTGVIKTLHEQNLLPRIVCGSSAGSIVASLLCTESYENVRYLIERDLKLGPFEYKHKKFSFLRRILRYLNKGVLLDVEVLKEFLRENIGDITFQEAYDKTGWILNITVTGYKEHDNHRLLNYLTAPNVLVWSASCASSCVPGLFEPTELLCKNEYGHIVPYSSNRAKFIDGSISSDLPMQRLSELFNVNIFLVSQTNPWVVPFLDQDDALEVFNYEKKFNFWKLLKNLLFSELKHRINQIQTLGLLPNAIKRVFNIVTQDYHGHVTIFPVPKIWDYFNIITNPTKESIAECVIHSSRRTYPKISFIDNILKFELALERHHKKLKSRLNKFNFSSDKKYELDDEDCYDDFNYKSILQDENNKATNEKLTSNINELINIKTDYFTNNSQMNIRENYTTQNENVGENDENSLSEQEEKISDMHNKIMFYRDEKEKNLNFESDFYIDTRNKNGHFSKNKQEGNILNFAENGIALAKDPNNNNDDKFYFKNDRMGFEAKNKLENIDISSINPMPAQNELNHRRKSTKGNKPHANQNPKQQGKNFLMRNDSFSLPRTNSKTFSNTKNKK